MPHIARGKCDVGRVLAVVVLKRKQFQIKYKLACRFGTIGSFYTASSLISYPAPVDILDKGQGSFTNGISKTAFCFEEQYFKMLLQNLM